MLENLKLLKEDMIKKGWSIDSFIFCYKNIDYVVLVKLYDSKDKKPQYALLKLEFIKIDDITRTLEIPANSNKLIIEAQKLREYFNIEYSKNLGDILKQFTELLGKFIPTYVNSNKTEIEFQEIDKSLSISDSQDPNRKYCYKVKRNGFRKDGSPARRSIYNDNITRIRRPNLYKKIGGDNTLSFCYSIDPNDEKSDIEIIENWTRNNLNF